MPKAKPLKYKVIKKKLKKLGCQFIRPLRGSHRVRYNPKEDKFFQAVDHGSTETIVPTILHMIKEAGIEKKDFYNA